MESIVRLTTVARPTVIPPEGQFLYIGSTQEKSCQFPCHLPNLCPERTRHRNPINPSFRWSKNEVQVI
jgi:hypothetical protein